MKQHQTLVRELKKSPIQVQNELKPMDCDMIHMIMGICGEAGELLDSIKKATIYQQEIDRENIVEELGDIEFYLEGLRQALFISREEVLEHNIEKLRKRYGQQYSDKAAQERADKQ